MLVSRKVCRWLFWIVLLVYGAAALALLGMRYWVLPNVDDWRPGIESYLSKALSARVTIGHLSADWRGWNLRLKVDNLTVYDPLLPNPVMKLPSASAILGGRSALIWAPTLVSLKLDAPELTLRRDLENRLWIAGQSIDLNGQAQFDVDHPVLRWLTRQRRVVVDNATVHWQDDLRATPRLTFTAVGLIVRNGTLSHRFALRARPPASMAANVDVRGEINRTLLGLHSDGQPGWHGQLYAELNDAQPGAWAPWISVPAMDGRIAARAWLRLNQGEWDRLTVDVMGRRLAWHAADGTAVQVASAQAQVRGLPGDVWRSLRGLTPAQSQTHAGLVIKGHVMQTHLNLPRLFESKELAFHTLEFDTTVSRLPAGPWSMEMRQLRLVNDDLDLSLQGTWNGEGKTAAGTVDGQGWLARGSMAAIHRYMPPHVNDETRKWLASGLLEGEIRGASIVLKGDLHDFPFARPGDPGVFRIAGAYTGATVDYASLQSGPKKWPPLENLAGHFAMDKLGLTVESQGGTVRTGDNQVITLGAVKAVIPDMENKAELTVEGDTTGQVEAYLALATHSPLGELLDGALEQAVGEGQWRVPLKLQVPLHDPAQIHVDGHIIFRDNRFSFLPQLPTLSQLRGEVAFSEHGVATKELIGEFLGGPIRLAGNLAQPNDVLRFEGSFTGASLAQLGQRGWQRFTGKADYRGRVTYVKGGELDTSIESDLAGMAIDLPAPLGKVASVPQSLKMRWRAGPKQGPNKRRLFVATLGNTVNLLLERDPALATSAYFSRGVLKIGPESVSPPTQGIRINARLPSLDLNSWKKVIREFGPAPSPNGEVGTRPALLPPVESVNLTTGLLSVGRYRLNDLTLHANRSASTQWKVEIASSQLTGLLLWRQPSGVLPGQITAHFKQLVFDGKGAESVSSDALIENQLSDIPTVDLQVEDLRVYGKALGSLQVRGTNLERGRRWRLDSLRIANEAASLDAVGTWQLDGATRGLTLDASLTLMDAGKLLDRLGWSNTMQGGSGTTSGKLSWHNFPWQHDIADIDGDAELKLDQGRLLNINFRAARLLELISMQSLRRLGKLQFDPANLLRDGFPFHTMRGHFKLANGMVTTDDYEVVAPIAAMKLTGNSDIINETWDLKAVVVPNVDASGAAIITALAVNPLVGLGAFVTQWLLKQLLDRAMTAEYTVTGGWANPKVEPIPAGPTTNLSKQPTP